MLRLILHTWTLGDWENRDKLRDGFAEHYKHIRLIVPKDRLLEFQSEDGWAPLCAFLDKPIPEQPYPHVNKGDNILKIHKVFLGMTLLRVVAKSTVWIAGAAGVAIGAVWYYRRQSMV